MTTFLEFENKQIEVVELEREHFNFILFKDVNSDDHYLYLLLNNSATYYDKTIKLKAEDIIQYKEKKIPAKILVDSYRGY